MRLSVGGLLVIRSLLVFNALCLFAFGGLLAFFMEWPPGLVFAACCWLTVGILVGLTRYVDRVFSRRP
jgi:Sec-independent protein secretion pathway component TatC